MAAGNSPEKVKSVKRLMTVFHRANNQILYILPFTVTLGAFKCIKAD